MIRGKKARFIRKTHRYLGIFLGIQFLFWTFSGLYFSWTNLDEIHGDHLKNLDHRPKAFTNLTGLENLAVENGIQSIELRDIGGLPYYWVNDKMLFNALTAEAKNGITKEEALKVAKMHMRTDLMVKDIELITAVDQHHEYREKLLSAYVISYQHSNNIKAYVSQADGKFQTVRHRSWRWFDFLWMTHTMDYESRDNFNTFLLRAFSLLGFITVLSGFLLWFISSSTLRRVLKNRKKR